MICSKHYLITNTISARNAFTVFKRFKAKQKPFGEFKKKKTACSLALSHFDDFYKSIFVNRWPSVRLALLSRPKGIAVINNFAEIQEAETILQEEGAFELRPFLEVQKRLNLIKKNPTKRPGSTRELDKIIQEHEKQKNKEEMEVFYPEKKFGNEKESKEEEFLSSSDNTTPSLHADMLKAEFEHERLIMPDSKKASMYEFLPATQLRGLENYIPESEYYKYYKAKEKMEINIDPQYSLDFPENLKVYIFDRGDVTEFPPPTRTANDVLNFLVVDGAELLPVLALNLQPKDNVLHMSPYSGNMGYCIFQTLRFKRLICSGNEMFEKTFKNYLLNYSTSWSDILAITKKDFSTDGRENLFEKILLDAPCTDDKNSLVETERNIFENRKLKERLKLPEHQTQVLVSALKLLRPGGTLVYTTSTLSPIQNDGVVREALNVAWEESKLSFTVKDLTSALSHMSLFFNFGEHSDTNLGSVVVPFVPSNFGPRYFCKIVRNE